MKKMLKILLFVIALLIILILVNTLRNYIIVRNLQKNIEAYIGNSNYHIKAVSNNTIANYYSKGKRQVAIVEKEDKKISIYKNGENSNIFIEDGKNKIAKLNSVNSMKIDLSNYLQTDNNWQTFVACIKAKVKKIDYEGKKCYVIENFETPMFIRGEGETKAYIDVESGLCLQLITDIETTKREYEFDNVDDTIFIEPELNQFVIQ